MVLDIYQEQVHKWSLSKTEVKEIEKEEIMNAMKECNWVMSRAARKLGITERMIGYRIKKYKLKREVKDIKDESKNNI